MASLNEQISQLEDQIKIDKLRLKEYSHQSYKNAQLTLRSCRKIEKEIADIQKEIGEDMIHTQYIYNSEPIEYSILRSTISAALGLDLPSSELDKQPKQTTKMDYLKPNSEDLFSSKIKKCESSSRNSSLHLEDLGINSSSNFSSNSRSYIDPNYENALKASIKVNEILSSTQIKKKTKKLTIAENIKSIQPQKKNHSDSSHLNFTGATILELPGVQDHVNRIQNSYIHPIPKEYEPKSFILPNPPSFSKSYNEIAGTMIPEIDQILKKYQK